MHRLIVNLLALAILVVAAGLLPSDAEAHAGHMHAPRALQAQHVDAAAASDTLAASALQGDEAGRPAAWSAVEAPGPDGLPPAGGCAGPCCGTGMCCCSVAALTTAAPAPRDSDRGRRFVRPPDGPVRPSAQPEALPEPPRPFV